MNPIIESVRDQLDVAANAIGILFEANVIKEIDTAKDGTPRIEIGSDIFAALFGEDYETIPAYGAYKYRVHKICGVYASSQAKFEVEDEG